MTRLRIAQKGWHLDRPALTPDDVQAGVALPWIEIDGHRIADGLQSVEFRAAPGEAAKTEVVMTFLDPIEVVYVGANGDVLASEKVSLSSLVGRVYNYLSVFFRPAS